MGKYKKLHDCDFKRFANRRFDKGIEILNLASWSEFHEVVKIFNNNTDYIWRGQANSGQANKEWSLKASFDREFPNDKERDAKLREILEGFKLRLYDLPNKQSLSDDEIWAIGQHYALPTPFLDWTESPYIAAYFAFYKNEPAGHRAIYALNKAVKRLILKKIKKPSREVLSREPFVEFIDFSGSNFDSMQNKRLKSQKGKFTKALNGIDIGENVRRLYELDYNLNEVLLAEILIPEEFQGDCLRFLKSKRITHGILFPDYQGVVDICEIELPVLKKRREK